MAKQFDGKVVLVAGGTGGLGKAVSQAFLGEDAKVAVTYRNEKEFSELKKTVDVRASLNGYQVDVTDDTAVSQLVKEIVAGSGRLDVMVNAVGAYAGGTPVWQTEPAVFDRMLALNLQSGYVLSRHVVPQMLKQRSGSIVSVSSRAAIDHAAGAAAYAASKAASVALFDSLAADLKGTGIRVNSVLPSLIDTDANRKAMPDADFSKWPNPEDIAKVIVFLCSEDAKLIHGASVPVYGVF
jgi:NAD(P)-dependent dehydrogenase (short-subunit alcohol dehydrogenase family)